VSSPAPKRQPVPFGKYLLLDRINIGGMAEVWRGKMFGAGGFERLVAIKRILPNIAEDEEFIRMFIDEAKISVQLTHANIAQIYELGQITSSFYIAMEYVPGKDLRAIFDRCRKKGEPAPIPLTCFVISKLCEGLDYAHRKKDGLGREMNIVHRDVSPQNVLVSYEGEVKVIDFGIAKAAGKATKTRAGILKGKFGYMSPEQIRGLPLDRRSDIFAIGVCLYELLTGERLFVGDSDFSVLEKVRKAEVLPPSTYNRRIPEALERIVLKALAREVDERYQYANELAEDLQRFLITSDSIFGRKDLMQYMKSTFAEEVERERLRLQEYTELEPPEGLGGTDGNPPVIGTPLPIHPPGQLSSGGATVASPPSRPPPPGPAPAVPPSVPAMTVARPVTQVNIPRVAPVVPVLGSSQKDDEITGPSAADASNPLLEREPTTVSGRPPPNNKELTDPLSVGNETRFDAPLPSPELQAALRPPPPEALAAIGRRETAPELPPTVGPFGLLRDALFDPDNRRWVLVVGGALVALLAVVGVVVFREPPMGYLVIKITPQDPNIKPRLSIGDNDLGVQTFPKLLPLPAGPNMVMITAPGYGVETKPVDVKKGPEYTEIVVNLKREGTAALMVITQPETAEIRVNGSIVRAEGTVSERNYFMTDAPLGVEQVVEVRAKQFKPRTETKKETDPKRPITVFANLEPYEYPVKLSGVNRDVVVSANGKELGKGSEIKVPGGTRELTLSGACYQPLSVPLSLPDQPSTKPIPISVKMTRMSNCF
jgi:serine/threonine protein kinase